MVRLSPIAILALTLGGCRPSNWFPIQPTYIESSGEGSSDASDSTDSSSTSDGSSSTSDGSEGGSGTSDTTSSTGAESTGAGQGSTGEGTTTGEPPEEFPLCGNGKVDGVEECDESSETCHGCKRDRFAFVTAARRTPDGIGGLTGADSLCKQYANKANLQNWQSYTAWLSDSTTDARDRIYKGRGRYVRVDMKPIADSWEELFSGQLLAPLEIDEFGQKVNGAAWTGTMPDGTAALGVDHCDDWTKYDNSKREGYSGLTITADAWWTLNFFPNPDPEVNPEHCSNQNHLYCFEGK